MKILKALAFLLVFAAPVACQEVRDSATVRVVDRTRLSLDVQPESFTGEVGDTITFMATVVDTVSGDTISAEVLWSTDDPTGIQVDPETGKARLLRAGTFKVYADLQQILGIVLRRLMDDGSLQDISAGLRLKVGESAQLCAYLVSRDGLWFRSGWICPSMLEGFREAMYTPLPVYPDFWNKYKRGEIG